MSSDFQSVDSETLKAQVAAAQAELERRKWQKVNALIPQIEGSSLSLEELWELCRRVKDLADTKLYNPDWLLKQMDQGPPPKR